MKYLSISLLLASVTNAYSYCDVYCQEEMRILREMQRDANLERERQIQREWDDINENAARGVVKKRFYPYGG